MPRLSSLTPTSEAIQDYYDQFAAPLHMLWGPHLHHGLFERDASPLTAQIRLIHWLITNASVVRGGSVLDAGSGLGGSAIWLAQHLRCDVTGFTLSSAEAAIARQEAQLRPLQGRVRFEEEDLETMSWPDTPFDTVWAVEVLEHLSNKKQFIENAAAALRPGGTLVLTTVAAGTSLFDVTPDSAQTPGHLWPSLATNTDLTHWCRSAGLTVQNLVDLSAMAAPTWDWAQLILERRAVQRMARMAGWSMQPFSTTIPALRIGYARRRFRYLALIASKK